MFDQLHRRQLIFNPVAIFLNISGLHHLRCACLPDNNRHKYYVCLVCTPDGPAIFCIICHFYGRNEKSWCQYYSFWLVSLLWSLGKYATVNNKTLWNKDEVLRRGKVETILPWQACQQRRARLYGIWKKMLRSSTGISEAPSLVRNGKKAKF